MAAKDLDRERLRRREYERWLRDEAKRMGMTYLQHREWRRGQKTREKEWRGEAFSRKRPLPGDDIPKIREVHDQLIADQPFIQELKSLQDTGRTRPSCPTCQKKSDFDDYFCIHCGEHFDWLYCYEHADAPIELTREQIMDEYAAADRPFRSQRYDHGQLKFRSVADLTGINYYARMPVEKFKEEDRWKGLTGFQREASSPTT